MAVIHPPRVPVRTHNTKERDLDPLTVAQRAAALKDDVLAIVAHDLRGLLNLIVLEAHSLPDGDAPGHGERPPAKQSILSAAGRMERLLGDLIEAARLDADPQPRETMRIPPARLLEECADTFRSRAQAADIRLEVAAPATEDFWLEGDAFHLQEALSNLVDNALKFTPRGGCVTLSAERAPVGLLVSVADTGCGIPRDNLAHLFDRFWQAQHAQRAGAGLGLFIVRRIVEGHGGRIWAESETGAGATFRILLPCCGGELQIGDPEQTLTHA